MEDLNAICYWLLMADIIILDVAILAATIYWIVSGGWEICLRITEQFFVRIKELFQRNN